MPYSNPTSPLASPAKDDDSLSKKGWPTHVEDILYSTSPMQGIPRRVSTSGGSTPQRVSPPTSRQPSAAQPAFPTSKPMEGLPRRRSSGPTAHTQPHTQPHTQQSAQLPPPREPLGQPAAFGSSSLPKSHGEGSLGLKLHPSPVKPRTSTPQSLKDSTSSVESQLPQTPESPVSTHPPVVVKSGENSDIPFPDFEPPPLQSHSAPHRILGRATANPRVGPPTRRGSDSGHRSTASLNSPPSYMTTSASTSQLETGTSLSPSSRPSTSMIRKKSGEIVKPSIKYHRSMSTPNLREQDDDREPPEAPESPRRSSYLEETPKSVRFADADGNKTGTHLESVILFLRQQKPAAVGHAVDPEHNGPVTDTETELDSAAENSDFVSFRTRRNASARAVDEGKVVMQSVNRIPRVRTDFSPDSQGCREGENVILERTELVTSDGVLTFKGTCIVRNLAFDKTVTARFTVDHWQTRSEVTCHHVCHIPSHVTMDEGWDRFGFSIKLEDVKRNLADRQLIVCIRYTCNGQDFWDSNLGDNYNFTFVRTAPSAAARRRQTSGPASLGSGLVQSDDDAATHLQDLRHRVASRNFASQDDIDTRSHGRRGRTSAATHSGFAFPPFKVRSQDVPSRTDSPVQSQRPPIAYKIPSPPDVHTHLSLSKYCAPSSPSPTSPSAELPPLPPLILGPVCPPAVAGEQPAMEVQAGQFATRSPPKNAESLNFAPLTGQKEDNGKVHQVHDVFSPSSDEDEEPEGLSTPRLLPLDGDLTPVGGRARSPVTGNVTGNGHGTRPVASLENKTLVSNKSTGDLQAMLEAPKSLPSYGLPTPPSSNLSSPHSSPNVAMPSHMLMSPGSSSTDESSPINSASTNNSLTDLANLMLDRNAQDRNRKGAADTKTLNQSSYQEFLDKFCFFTSPRSTPANDDPTVYSARQKTVSLPSGTSSPGGFPFFSPAGGSSLDSPRTTPTGDGFGSTRFSPVKAGNPRPSPGQASPSFNVLDSHHWAKPGHRRGNSASLAAQ